MSDLMMRDGFVWTLLGEREIITKRLHVRTTLLVWQGLCVTCGTPFEITTRRKWSKSELDGNLELRRCKAHRLSRDGTKRLRNAQ